MINPNEVQILIDFNEEKNIIEDVEIVNSELTEKELKKLEKGFKKQLNKILKNDEIIDKEEKIEKEKEKCLKKVLSKQNKNKNKEEKPKLIKIKEIKIDEEFVKMCNFVNQDLFKNLNKEKETQIKEIKLLDDSVLIIDTLRRKKTKNIKEFIENFFNVEISNYRNLLIKGYKRFKEYEFKITDKVRKYYLEYKYDENSKYSLGTLDSSCMRYDSCNKFMRFYEKENIKLLILKNKKTDKIVGRSLIWDEAYDEDGDNFPFIDRIYGDDITIALFRRWAYLNGYASKKYQSYDEKMDFLYNGKTVEKTVYYDMKNDIEDYECHGIPYLDTMTFYLENGSLTNSGYERYLYELDSTDGNSEIFTKYVECSICGDEISEEDAFWTPNDEPMCYYCEQNTAGWCPECGERITYEDLSDGDGIEFDGEFYCQSCFKKKYVYCVDFDDYALKEDAIWDENTKYYYYYEENIPKNDEDDEEENEKPNTEEFDIKKHVIFFENEKQYKTILKILYEYFPNVKWITDDRPTKWWGEFYNETMRGFIIGHDYKMMTLTIFCDDVEILMYSKFTYSQFVCKLINSNIISEDMFKKLYNL